LLSPDLAGLMSALERRYQRHVERPHGLPAGIRQARARTGVSGPAGHHRGRDIRLRRAEPAATLGR
jgi:hypothetical protein